MENIKELSKKIDKDLVSFQKAVIYRMLDYHEKTLEEIEEGLTEKYVEAILKENPDPFAQCFEKIERLAGFTLDMIDFVVESEEYYDFDEDNTKEDMIKDVKTMIEKAKEDEKEKRPEY